MDEIRFEHLTTVEIGAAIAGGARTAILPLAAVEQHGGHLAVSMDADHADELAVRIARELGGALVLPTVRVGFSPYHLKFPGTLSLRASTLEAICEDYCRGLAAHGFERVVLFSGHIGNYPVMRDFEARLVKVLDPLSVIVFTDDTAILRAWRVAAEHVAGLGANVGGHADVAETSVMLALHPGKVRLDRAAPGYAGVVDAPFLARVFDEGIDALSPSGVLGDPRGASTSIGTACLGAVTSVIAQFAQSRGA